MKEPKILIYDIETSLVLFSGFSCGEQVLRHGDLLEGYFSRTHIMTIAYKWSGEKKSYVLTWGNSIEDERKMIEDFDKVIMEADVVIGKNSNRFDNKHLNAQRLFHGLPAIGDWAAKTDDLEVLLRRHFNVQSQSLDYWSKQMGIGGKIKMSKDNHWTPLMQGRALELMLNDPKRYHAADDTIINQVAMVLFNKGYEDISAEYDKAMKDMIKYNKKDVHDTDDLLQLVKHHVKQKFNHGKFNNMVEGDDKIRCRQCGSDNVAARGNPRLLLSSQRQEYKCLDCKGYAGSVLVKTPKGLT